MSGALRFVKKRSGSEGFEPTTERKKKPSHRNPFKDLNNFNRNSSSSSTLSIEAPRGCLSFFLSNSSSKTPPYRPKNLPKTPKSVPNHGPSQCRPKPPAKLGRSNGGTVSGNLERPKRSPCLHQWQNGRKRSFKATQQPKPSSDLVSGVCLKEVPLKEKEPVDTGEPSDPLLFGVKVDLEEYETPVNKLAPGFGLDSTPGKAIEENSTTANTTPPVLPSISPEIQCGSSLVSTPTCFGAGHVLSGVTDKRKCRPRGVLTVVEDVGPFNISRASLVPVPTVASVHWLSPPCDVEEEDQRGRSMKGSLEFGRMKNISTFHSPYSSSSGHDFSSHVCSISNSASSATTGTTCNISPIEFPDFGGFVEPMSSVSQKRHSSDHAIGCSSSYRPVPPPTSNFKHRLQSEERGHWYDVERDNSPFSSESLDSGNVIRTPQSDSSSDRRFGLSWLDEDSHREYQLKLDSMANILHNTHLSPQSQI